jgi:hypothetical protein
VRFLLARLGREGVPGRSLGAHTGQRYWERAALPRVRCPVAGFTAGMSERYRTLELREAITP